MAHKKIQTSPTKTNNQQQDIISKFFLLQVENTNLAKAISELYSRNQDLNNLCNYQKIKNSKLRQELTFNLSLQQIQGRIQNTENIEEEIKKFQKLQSRITLITQLSNGYRAKTQRDLIYYKKNQKNVENAKNQDISLINVQQDVFIVKRMDISLKTFVIFKKSRNEQAKSYEIDMTKLQCSQREDFIRKSLYGRDQYYQIYQTLKKGRPNKCLSQNEIGARFLWSRKVQFTQADKQQKKQALKETAMIL